MAGIPTICFALPGPSEIVKHGHNGYIVNSRSVKDFASAIALLARNRDLRRRLSLQAKIDGERFDARLAIPLLIDAL